MKLKDKIYLKYNKVVLRILKILHKRYYNDLRVYYTFKDLMERAKEL